MENYWNLVKAAFASDWFMALISNIPLAIFVLIGILLFIFILYKYSKKNVITRSSILLIIEVALIAGLVSYGIKNWAPSYEFVDFISPYKEDVAQNFLEVEFNTYKLDPEKGYKLLKQNSAIFFDYQVALKKRNIEEDSVRKNFDVKVLECIGDEANPKLLQQIKKENKKSIWDIRKDLTVEYMHCSISSSKKIVIY